MWYKWEKRRYIRKDIEMRGENGEKIRGSGRIESAGDFSVIVDPYLLSWQENKIFI